MILFQLFASTIIFMTRSVNGAFGQRDNPGLAGGTNLCNPPLDGIERPIWEPPVQIPNGPPAVPQPNGWV